MAKKKSSVGKKLAIGAGLAAVGTAAYMLLGPEGKKNQIKLKKFAGKVKVVAMKDAKMIMKQVKNTKKMVMKDVKQIKKVVKKNTKQGKKK